jgi:hypothetical protein
VRLSPLGTLATNWPIVPAPDDRWWVWSSRWNENWHEKPKYSEETYPRVTLFTTNSTWPEPGSNPDRRSGKPATNRLSYGTALIWTNCSRYGNWLRAGRSRSRSSSPGKGKIFLLYTEFTPVLGPTKPPVNGFPGVSFSWGKAARVWS